MIMNISDLNIFPIFIFNFDTNFPSLQPKSAHFFDFNNFFGFIRQKIPQFQPEVWKSTDKIKRIHRLQDFSHKSGKLAIHVKDDYYINWKNAQIGKTLKLEKFFIIFPEIWTDEGKTDNEKTAITVSFDFSTQSESRICKHK